MHYSIGWKLGARERAAIDRVPAPAWGAVLDTDGHPGDLDEAGVVELTALLREHPDGDQLGNLPTDLRIICRREKPHPGAQRSLFEEIGGWRYQLLATNTPGRTAQFLEARHRPHALVEDNIRNGKQTGLGHLPSTSIDINRAWCVAATASLPPSPYPHQPDGDQQTPRPRPKTPTRTVEPGAHPTRQSGQQSEPHLDNNINEHHEDQHLRVKSRTRQRRGGSAAGAVTMIGGRARRRTDDHSRILQALDGDDDLY